ncbi:SHOCT domain-containing protein [Janibacter alittae]|uniref:SHOCT domain-containing protein n=1 Tax=Janibacter alittae TaxID=3115209 RepID=A0ABZ2MJS4_9MICO
MSFWDVLWLIIVSFGFLFYLMMLFSIIGDLFADHDTRGIVKAVWVIFLLFLPLLTALVYLIVRGDGMARRRARSVQSAIDAQDAYIKSVATAAPADQIQRAKALLEDGTITQQEYDSLKSKALS